MGLIILWTKTEREKKKKKKKDKKYMVESEHGPKNNGQKSFGPNLCWTK